MDTYRLADVVRAIGGEQVTLGAGKVQCCCLLARWTHSKGRDTRPSMVVFVEGKHGEPIYSCLACHERGSLRDLVLFLWSRTGMDLFPWVELLDDEAPDFDGMPTKKSERAAVIFKAGPPKPSASIETTTKVRDDGRAFYDYMCIAAAADVPEIPWSVFEPYAGSVPRYAIDPPPEGRGIAVATCKEWELGHDRGGKRLLFPMRNRKGRLVAISGRIYVEDECIRCGSAFHAREGERARCVLCGVPKPPPYLHSDGFKRNLHLYGEHRRQDKTDGRVYLVEGHIDVLIMWQLGYRPVVATLGSYPGPAQIEKLIAYYKRIIVVPDGDKAGIKFGATVKKMVAGRIPVTVRQPAPGSDPGGLGVEDPAALLRLLGPPPFRVDETLSIA